VIPLPKEVAIESLFALRQLVPELGEDAVKGTLMLVVVSAAEI